MNDLLSLYEVLRLPSGAQLVSDRGEVTLLTIAHDGPNKLTLERVPLGAAVSVETLFSLLEQRGIYRTDHDVEPLQPGRGRSGEATDTSTQQNPDQDVLAWRDLAHSPVPTTPSSTAGVPPPQGSASQQSPCQHHSASAERLAAPAIETSAPPVPHEKQDVGPKKRSGPAKGFTFPRVLCPHCGEPIAQNQLVKHTKACAKRAAAPEPSAPALPPSYGEALPPDHSFRDELLSAIERKAA